ncbi:MAG: glycoside hydrolase family protein [Desulfomicrobium sp.]|nr:glycoside hydrolase family protein [Desulfomicrobium sp.]
MIDQIKTEEELIIDEGIRLRRYKCTAGVWTIGVGHVILISDNLGPDEAVSLEWCGRTLRQDILKAWSACVKIFSIWTLEQMTEPRQRALVNMAFQLGETKLRGFKKMIAAINAGDWETAKKECLDSKYATQAKKRAQRVAEVLRTGKD